MDPYRFSTTTATKLIIGVGIAFFCFGCRSSEKPGNDLPPSLYPPPLTVKLNTDSGYKINPVTGDSVKPAINSNGNIIKSGIPIPVTEKVINASTFKKPEAVPASWIDVGSLETNVYPVEGKFAVIPLDESKIRKFIIGKDTSSFILIDNNNDTIPTGVPIIVKGKSVQCIQPQPQEALPMSFSNSSMYNIKFIDTYHGLNKKTILDMLEDRHGNLWMASGSNLTWYDGKMFFTYTINEGLTRDPIINILEDRKGDIWMNHGNGKISVYDGEQFIHYKIGVGGGPIGNDGILEDSKGNIWFANTVYGVTRFDGKNFMNFSVKEGFSDNPIFSMGEDIKGDIWFCVNEGLYKYDGRSFAFYSSEDCFGIKDLFMYTIATDKGGYLWIASSKGLIRYDGKEFKLVALGKELGYNIGQKMIIDENDNVWIGTGRYGLICYNGETITQITEQEGLSGNYVSDLTLGNNGNLWIATDKGLSYFNREGIKNFGVFSNLIKTSVYKLIESKDGALLLATANGLFKYNGHLIERLQDKNSFSKRDVYSVLEDKQHNIWMGSLAGSGMLFYNGSTLTHFTVNDGLLNNSISAMLLDQKGNIWIGTGVGLSCYDGKKFIHYTEEEGLGHNVIMSLTEDRQGNIWIGTRGGGVTKYDGKTFTTYSEKEGLINNFISSLVTDLQNDIWIGTFNGVSMFDGKTFTNYTTKQGLNNGFAAQITEDKNGNIWILNNDGFSCILKDQNHDQQLFSGSKSMMMNFNQKDGLKLDILNGKIDRLNRLWLTGGINFELSVLNLNNFRHIESPPVVTLKNVMVNDKQIDFRSITKKKSGKISFTNVFPFSNIPQDLKLNYDFSRLTFHFTAIGQLASEHILYCYKMEGLSKEWSTPSGENQVRYEYLPPGTYTFKVRAMNRTQVWGEPSVYHFTIIAPFWQRWWFYTLCGFLVLGTVVFVMRKRATVMMRRQKEKSDSEKKMAEMESKTQQAILKERLRISTELHDEIGATLSGIAMYSHLSKEQIKAGHQTDVERSLNIIQQSSGEMVDKLNDIVWLVNPEKDSLKKLLERLEEYARNMAAIKNIKVNIVMPIGLHEKILPVEVRRNIYLFCKEAINNAVKYSGGDQLELIIKETNGNLEFTVNDNGKGFDEVMVRRGNGLENMQKRADEIGAQLNLQSKLNEGVKVSMQYKIT